MKALIILGLLAAALIGAATLVNKHKRATALNNMVAPAVTAPAIEEQPQHQAPAAAKTPSPAPAPRLVEVPSAHDKPAQVSPAAPERALYLDRLLKGELPATGRSTPIPANSNLVTTDQPNLRRLLETPATPNR